MTDQFCVAITLPDNTGSGWAELFGGGFYFNRHEPVYMSRDQAEETRAVVRSQVPGTVVEILQKPHTA